jgi:hypothetical protein
MRSKKKSLATILGSYSNGAEPQRSRRTSDGKAYAKTVPLSARLSSSDGCLTIRLPLTFARRRGRKRIITPDGKTLEPASHAEEATTLVKAIARAYHWKRMLEEGHYTSMQDLANAEKVTPSFLARILRLTLLAPDIVEQAVRNPNSDRLSIDAFMQPFPPEWDAQRAKLF